MASHISARRRILTSVAVGLAPGLAVGFLVDPFLGVASGWVAATGTYLLWTWLEIAPMDAAATHEHAAAEDPSRATFHAAALVTSILSLAAVVVALIRSGTEQPPISYLQAGAALAIVATSWMLVHTLYTLRYAHLFTLSDADKPVDFNQPQPPSYLDFAYLASSLGMTYQVSDTNIGDSAIRRAALAHSLISFVFGVVILATTINLIAGMMSSGG